MAKIKEGMLVTWGSGAPRARVTMILNSWVAQGVRVDTDARVELIEDVTAPCGHVFPAGTEVDMSLTELRPVN